MEVYIETILLLQVFRRLFKGKDITFSKNTIWITVLLYSIVCQMYKQVLFILKSELFAREPTISFPEIIAFVLVCYKHPQSNIKLAFTDQKRLLYVLLHHENIWFDISLTWYISLFTRRSWDIIQFRCCIIGCICSGSLPKWWNFSLSFIDCCEFKYQTFQLINRAEELYSSSSIGICRLQ